MGTAQHRHPSLSSHEKRKSVDSFTINLIFLLYLRNLHCFRCAVGYHSTFSKGKYSKYHLKIPNIINFIVFILRLISYSFRRFLLSNKFNFQKVSWSNNITNCVAKRNIFPTNSSQKKQRKSNWAPKELK